MKYLPVFLSLLVLCSSVAFSKQELKGTMLLKVYDARFYAVAAEDLDKDGKKEIIAAGQKGSHHPYSGFVVIYTNRQGQWSVLAKDTFEISHQGQNLSGRIRALEIRKGENDTWTIYTAGRGGSDEEGVGFLRRANYNSSSASFKQTALHVFYQKESKYSHGYPLAVVKNPLGNNQTAIAYGGFSSAPEGKGDLADVRLFNEVPGEKSRELPFKPFKDLPVTLRVNALTSGDFDSDGKGDVLVAGRTHTGKEEYASLALHLNGQSIYHIIKDALPSRLRTLLVTDFDRDGSPDILTGGRSDLGEFTLARLDLFTLEDNTLISKSRYCWTGDGSIRLRDLVKIPGKNPDFISLGRIQLKGKRKAKWHGFLATFEIRESHITPKMQPQYYSFGKETRFRSGVMLDETRLLTGGFILDKAKKSTAFVFVTGIN